MRGNDLADVIIERSPSFLSAMKLQKLLYYVDSWHLAITNEHLITDVPFQAWKDGPVHPPVWAAHRDDSKRRKAGSRRTGTADLDATAEGIVELVMDKYGQMSGDELSVLTHAERPWLTARQGLPTGAPSDRPLADNDTKRWFRSQKLGGHTAADLASGGVYATGPSAEACYDLDALLASCEVPTFPYDEPSYNLVTSNSSPYDTLY